MSKDISIIKTPPFEVETAIRQLGANLRTARLARNLSIADVAAKLGVSPRAIRGNWQTRHRHRRLHGAHSNVTHSAMQ